MYFLHTFFSFSCYAWNKFNEKLFFGRRSSIKAWWRWKMSLILMSMWKNEKKINKENSKRKVFWNLFPVKNPIKLSVHMPYVSLIINSWSNKKNFPVTRSFPAVAFECARWKKSFDFECFSQSSFSSRIQSDFNFYCDRFPSFERCANV